MIRAATKTLPVLLALLLGPRAAAYTPTTTSWPGSVKGVVKVSGALGEAPQPVSVDVDTSACGTERPASFPNTGEDARLAGAVVFLSDIDRGRSLWRRQVFLDIRDCNLQTTLAATVGDELQVGSVDSVAHRVMLQFVPDAGTPEDWGHAALVPGGQRVRMRLTQPGWLTVVGQGARSHIRTVVRVNENPYIGLTGSDGTFDLKDVPAGHYVVHFWHPLLGGQQRAVDVRAGYPTKLELALPAAGFKPDGVPVPSPARAPP